MEFKKEIQEQAPFTSEMERTKRVETNDLWFYIAVIAIAFAFLTTIANCFFRCRQSKSVDIKSNDLHSYYNLRSLTNTEKPDTDPYYESLGSARTTELYNSSLYEEWEDHENI